MKVPYILGTIRFIAITVTGITIPKSLPGLQIILGGVALLCIIEGDQT